MTIMPIKKYCNELYERVLKGEEIQETIADIPFAKSVEGLAKSENIPVETIIETEGFVESEDIPVVTISETKSMETVESLEPRVDLSDIRDRLAELEASVNSLSSERADYAESESARIQELISSIVSTELAQHNAESAKIYDRIESLSGSINQKIEVSTSF
jgi:hypothetical protein